MSDNMDAPKCPAHNLIECRVCMDALDRYDRAHKLVDEKRGDLDIGTYLLRNRVVGKEQLYLAWRDCYELGLLE